MAHKTNCKRSVTYDRSRRLESRATSEIAPAQLLELIEDHDVVRGNDIRANEFVERFRWLRLSVGTVLARFANRVKSSTPTDGRVFPVESFGTSFLR